MTATVRTAVPWGLVLVLGCSGGGSQKTSDAGQTCPFGEATSDATSGALDLFGTPAYFNGGDPVPAGSYTITYVDGCMKYSATQGWTVNAYDDTGCCNWWVIGETTTDRKLVPPGTIGFNVGAGAFQEFADCVAASLLSAPKMFDHTGGRLGIWLQDSPYTDNLAGQDDRNPKWSLDRQGSCNSP